MADDQMLIRVVLDASKLEEGMTKLKIFETDVRKGVGTFEDFSKVTANAELQLQKLYATGKITDEQYAKFGRTLQLMTERAQNSFVGMASALNTRALPAVNEFTRIISDAPYGARGMANNVQQLASLFGSLAVQTGGAKIALKEMLVMMAGPAGIVLGINALVSGIVAWSNSTESAKRSQFDFNAELERQKDIRERILELKHDTGAITDQAYRTELLSELTLLQTELERLSVIERINAAKNSPLLGPDGKPVDLTPQGIIAGSRKTQTAVAEGTATARLGLKPEDMSAATRILEIQQKMLEIQKRLSAGGSDLSMPKQLDTSDSDTLVLESVFGRQYRTLLDMMKRRRMLSQMSADQRLAIQQNDIAGMRQDLTSGFKLDTVKEVKQPPLGKSFKETQKELTGFEKQFINSTQFMAANIDDNITKAWRRSFGEANSLLQSFALGILKTMGNVASQMATAGIFKLLGSILLPGSGGGFLSDIAGGIFKSLGFKMAGGGIIGEPVVGMGLRSGASYAFGENGPEMVIPNNQLMASRFTDRRGPQVVVLESRIKGSDLVLVHSKASVDRAGRIM